MIPLDSSVEQWSQPSARGSAQVDLAEREELLAKRLRDLQQEVVARRRELASATSGVSLPNGGDLGVRDVQSARGARPDLLSRSMPGFQTVGGGAMSARSVVKRDSLGHLSWKDPKDCNSSGKLLRKGAQAHEEAFGNAAGRDADDSKAFGVSYAGAESFVGVRRSHSTSPRFKEIGTPECNVFVERQVPQRQVSVPVMEKEVSRHPACSSGAREHSVWDEHAELDSTQLRTHQNRLPTSAADRERYDEGSDSVHTATTRDAQSEVCFGDKVSQRHAVPTTIKEDARDGRWPDETEPSESETTAAWMAGLRSSDEDETAFDDPLVFGAGFKPKRQSFTTPCGPWAASFHMGGQPLPSRRLSSEYKSSTSKADSKPEAKSEMKFESRQPKPDAKAPSVPHRERKPVGPQTRPQASPQNTSPHPAPQASAPNTRVPLFQAPPQGTGPQSSSQTTSQSGARVRAQSCPRVGAQSGSQARSPRSSHNGTASPPRPQGFNVRSPRNDTGVGTSGSTAPPPQAPKAPGRSPSPAPPSPPTSGPPPQFGGSHRMGGMGAPTGGGTAGKARQGARRTAPCTSGMNSKAKPLETLKAEMSKLRRVRSPDDRKKHFLKLCFQWHPDKNPANVQVATKGFQMLQEKKGWLLG